MIIMGGNMEGFTRVMTTAAHSKNQQEGDLPLALGLGLVNTGCGAGAQCPGVADQPWRTIADNANATASPGVTGLPVNAVGARGDSTICTQCAGAP
jgi:hypothetical protein